MAKKRQDDRLIEEHLSGQYELLKVVAEQNHERLLSYDIDEDTLYLYSVVNAKYVQDRKIEKYLGEKKLGEVFVGAEDKQTFIRAFRKCLTHAMHSVLDVVCIFEENENKEEHYRLYLASVENEDHKVTQIAGRFVSVQKDWLRAERMKHKAEYDALTRVYNHKAFEQYCEWNLKNFDENTIFLMLDVDDFKMINDTQGHNVGDMVLAETGRILKEAVEGRGLAGRLGGDEFAALVTGFVNRAQMHEFCQQLRMKLKGITFDMEYCCSMGISVRGDRGCFFQDLYVEADQAVYASKEQGKNQYVFFDEIDRSAKPVRKSAARIRMFDYEQADERNVLEIYGDSVFHIRGSELTTGINQMLTGLRMFYDADCAILFQWDGNTTSKVNESHRESADIMAKLLTDGAYVGHGYELRSLIDDEGDIFLPEVKSVKKIYPEAYETLAKCRIWSLLGADLRDQDYRGGILCVINAHKHLEEGIALRMLSDYLVSKIMYQNLQAERSFEITHDPLTQLWNRDSFVHWGKEFAERRCESLGIITTDVVALEFLNQELGYLGGNRRLIAIAETLTEIFSGYRVFRYDLDEMLVFCENISKSDFMFMIQSLNEKVEEFDFALAIGYSWRADVNITEQITEAEVVMGNDKQRLMSLTSLNKRMEQAVIDEVKHFISTGKYLVYLQPKVNVKAGITVGAEALVRQIDEDLGIVNPGTFIPVLERYGCTHYVDLYVLEKVFQFQKAAVDRGERTVPISVNFSKITIMQPDLIERVRTLTERYDIPAGLIHIEVTETIGDMDHFMTDQVANQLKTLGFKLSMDDFGTHYSNLAVLIQYDFDSAKLDRSMIAGITTNHKSRVVLEYMTSLINELGIDCVVEGIETKEQVEILKNTKCDEIQGFFFGKPVPCEKFYETFM